MSLAKTAIEKAYASQITTLYNALAAALINADTDEKQQEAVDKFKSGVAYADSVKEIALNALD